MEVNQALVSPDHATTKIENSESIAYEDIRTCRVQENSDLQIAVLSWITIFWNVLKYF